LSRGPKFIAILILGVLIVFAVVNAIGPNGGGLLGTPPKQLTTGEVYELLAKNNISEAKWQGTELTGVLKGPSKEKFVARVPEPSSNAGAALEKRLDESDATWDVLAPPMSSSLIGILSFVGFPLMFFAFLY